MINFMETNFCGYSEKLGNPEKILSTCKLILRKLVRERKLGSLGEINIWREIIWREKTRKSCNLWYSHLKFYK